jgi:hypothetical protein
MKSPSARSRLISIRFLFCLTSIILSSVGLYAQEGTESEIEDNTSVPARQFLIDGNKVTFSSDPSNFEYAMIGTWESKECFVKKLNFSDSETVVVTFANKQVKGNWSLSDGVVTIQLKQNETGVPSNKLSGHVIEIGQTFELKGYGSFVKNK